MDLELLRTFLELNRTRHFGRASEALFVTQAAVSNRLKSLERQLGVSLFERSTRDMRLTPEGARLVRHAQRLIAAWRTARQDVSLAGASQQLVIGGSIRLWDALLQRWLRQLRRHYPAMAIIAETQATDLLTRKLIDGTLDVAVLLEPSQLETMHSREIAAVELILVSSEPALSVEAALDGDYVFVDWGLSFGLDHRRTFPDAPEAMTRVSHAKMAVDYISQLGGSAYLPRIMVHKEIDLGLLYHVDGSPTFALKTFAVYPVRSPKLDLIEQSLALVLPA